MGGGDAAKSAAPIGCGLLSPAKIRSYFLKKRRPAWGNQKTFGPAGVGTAVANARRTESLFAARRPGSFSSEKEGLSLESGRPGK